MPITISNLLQDCETKKYATETGRRVHAHMQFAESDPEIMKKIKTVPGLCDFFGSGAKTEVPLAGIIDGHFISRRIDRMVINDALKTIKVLDYKTDTNPATFRSQYISQLHEYRNLLAKIYPEYSIELYILWLHDWCLEKL